MGMKKKEKTTGQGGSEMNYRRLEKGTEVYYTGDMANHAGFGSITLIREDEYGVQYKVMLRGEKSKFGRPFSFGKRTFWVSPVQFGTDPGDRLMTREDFENKPGNRRVWPQ